MITAALITTGCSGSTGSDSEQGAKAGSGTGEITVWAHQGQPGEVTALQQAVSDFNAANKGVTASLRLIPEADYAKTIAASSPDALPDVLEFDGPTMSSLVYNGKLSPLSEFINPQTENNATNSVVAQGTAADGKIYGLAMFDSGLGLYANKSLLDAAGVSYPTSVDQAWTVEQFDSALEKLAAADADRKVLDLAENVGFDGEWGSYAFSPVLSSAGTALMTGDKAAGTLDSDTAVTAIQEVASWRQFVDPNTDTKAFSSGRVPLSWSGHWSYPEYSKALGSNLLVLPLPNFGKGAKTGQGSWAWGISSGSDNAKAAGVFLDDLLSDKSVKAMTTANGAPPGTRSGLINSAAYREDGPLALFAEQLNRTCGDQPPTPECVAVPRPVTPGYPVISKAFSGAFSAIYRGADAKSELSKAAREIDRTFAENDGYRVK
ncbi:extracellular solute-binding protein [Lentzea sp. HUAS12]|uniref:sugar ABC transporter substrate-binding protein n=1 Tax=Lentzea sp. HUAS12 TaxID=2951806 RepID=UPI0020A0D31B|nr:extracellular solute-binding protein [Lentzea sp. HUAS12]USX56255.1 extracellular solute-binding protein [Lentzea sp. HUAS12]